MERSQLLFRNYSLLGRAPKALSLGHESHGTVHAIQSVSDISGPHSVKSVRHCIVSIVLLFAPLAWAGATGLGGEFTLRTTKNEAISLSSFQGKAVLLYFGFTHCPEMCPTELLQFKQLISMLPAEKRPLFQPIFISIDPKRDTPEVLDPYIGFFDKRILALTGNEQELRKVANQYGVHFRYVRAGSSYTVDHTVNTFLIDTQGKLVRIFPYGTPTQEIFKQVMKLLR